MTDLKIYQKTPVRVSHRRSLLIRERFIQRMSARVLGPNLFLLDMTTSAGTYVKEFVHGDLGRTTPSVGDLLGTRADILQLDVLDVHDGVMEEIHRRNAEVVTDSAAKRLKRSPEDEMEAEGQRKEHADAFLSSASDDVRRKWRSCSIQEMGQLRLAAVRQPSR